jgi:hypothetical protein
MRYFVERSIQDAKSELGWDELEAQKYLAWMHHLALTILALWFVTQTKIELEKQYAHDPACWNSWRWTCCQRCPQRMYEFCCVPPCLCRSQRQNWLPHW